MLNQIEEKFTKVFIRALRMWVLVGNGPLDDTFAEVTKGIWNTIGAGIVKRNEGPIEVLSGTYTISDGANDYVVNYRSSVNFMHDYLVLPRQSYTKTHTITHTIIGIKFHIRKIGKSVGSKIERTEFQLVPGVYLNTLQSVDDDERVYVAQTVINRYIKRVNTYRVLQNVGWSTAVSKTLDSLVLRAIVELTTLGKLKPSYPVYNYTSSQEVVIDVMEISGDMHLVGLMLIGRDRSDVGAAKVGMGIYNSITQERVDGD